MTRKLKLGLGLAGALLLGACNVDPQVATPNQVLIGINAYNTGVAAGRAYLRLPLCGVSKAPCRTQGLSQQVYVALKSGRVAREQLLWALAANQAAPLGALQALQTAYAVIQSLPQQ